MLVQNKVKKKIIDWYNKNIHESHHITTYL